MNRRTFIKLTGITTLSISMPAIAKIDNTPKWTRLCDGLPKEGQKIVLVMYPIKHKPQDYQKETISAGTVVKVEPKRWSEYKPGLLIDVEMKYQKSKDLTFKGGYDLTHKQNINFPQVWEYHRKMKFMKGELIVMAKQGSSYTFNSLNLCNYHEPSFDYWCPIDQVPNTLPNAG
jgi:hypothetical protein